tara:strand:+ start:2257 stop:3123 length:867 start_codon:yes stop_codon:yes gene_type:complete
MHKNTSFIIPNNNKNKNHYNDFSTKKTIVMGILNITEDSFYDGGKYNNTKSLIQQTKKMLDEGASIIDIGAQSSRPGSKPITEKKELEILIPNIILLKSKFKDIIISVDTYRSKVAEECVKVGAEIINDISAGEFDKNMFDTIKRLNVTYIIMHMQGNPTTMQNQPKYKNVTNDIIVFFEKKIKLLKKKKINNLVIDPGFGFGKNLNHNYEILRKLKKFKKFKLPILVGASRKSMIYKLLETNPQNALNGSSIINTIAILNGANILRVHDVKEAVECIKITNFLSKKK